MTDIIEVDTLKQLALDEHDSITTGTKKSLIYGWDSNNLVKVRLKVDANGQLYVTGVGGSGAILDGVDADIKATVLDYTNSNPLAVRLTDTDGNYVGAGAGTQYADGAARGTATGTLAMGDDGTNIQSLSVDSSGHLQVDILSGGGAGEQYADNTVVNATYKGNLVLGTDGSNYQILAVDSSGNLQIDVLTMPTTTVQATNLDIRDLTSVSDSVAAVQSGTWNIGTVTTLTGITNVVHVDDNAGALTVDGSVTADTELPAAAALSDTIANPTTPMIGAALMGFDGTNWERVKTDGSNALFISDAGSSLTIDNTALTTADLDTGAGTDTRGVFGLLGGASGGGSIIYAGGGVEANALRVTIASDSTGVLSVDDNAGSLTVDNTGTFAVQAAQSGTWNIGTLTGITNVVHVDDNASTISIDDGASSITIDGTVAATQSGTWNVGTITTLTGITNVVHIDDNAGSLTVDGSVSLAAAIPAGTNNIGDVDIASIAVGDNNIGNVDIVTFPAGNLGQHLMAASLSVVPASNITDATYIGDIKFGESLPAGTNAIGKLAANNGVDIGDVDIKSIAAGDNNIGNVDVVSLPALAAGTNAIGKLTANSGVDIGDVDVASAIITGGSVAHDAADSANPIKIGGRADTTYQAAVADGDRVDALFDVYGQQRVRTDHANLWSYHLNTSSAQTDTQIKAAPGAGLSIYITDIVFSTGAATAANIFFEEGATKILGPYYLEAIAGRGLALHFQTPKKCTANTAITYTTSAAIVQAIDVMGFIGP